MDPGRYPAILVVMLTLVGCGALGDEQASDLQSSLKVGRHIVVLDDSFSGDPATVAQGLGLKPDRVYTHALKGFAVVLPPKALKVLQQDPAVRGIVPDTPVHAYAQTMSTGHQRIDATINATAKINGVDERVDVDIAILDTGIDEQHPDLNVVGGAVYGGGNPNSYDDADGHGTHVAGIAAALDNGTGVVGVAPGARLWAVRVLDRKGSGYNSDVIDGVDWVTANASVIEVANMSLGGGGQDYGNCGVDPGTGTVLDPLHKAICASVAAGVTYVCAAGNEMDDAAHHTPGAYDEVITVSALADFDGQPGGTGSGNYAFSSCTENVDDSLACFSNYGPDVDIMAPGVGIYSAYVAINGGSTYASLSGTSQATPFVAGAAALYLAKHPGASPAQVKAALLAAANHRHCPGGTCSDDPDSIQEPLLYLGLVDEAFETSTPGISLSSGGAAGASVVSGAGQGGSNCLRLQVTSDTPGVYDYVVTELCFNNPVTSYARARLAVRFDALASWDAVAFSGGGDWLYWWWVNSAGNLFATQSVGTLTAQAWHQLDVTVNRAAGSASFSLDGGAAVTEPLTEWPATSQPIECLLLFGNGGDTPHFFDVDGVDMTASPMY